MMTHGKNPEGHARGWEPHALPGKGVRSRSGAHSLRELRTDHVRPSTWKRNGGNGFAGKGRATQREPLSQGLPLGDRPLSPGLKAVARKGSFLRLPTSILIKPQIPLDVLKIAKYTLSAC